MILSVLQNADRIRLTAHPGQLFLFRTMRQLQGSASKEVALEQLESVLLPSVFLSLSLLEMKQ